MAELEYTRLPDGRRLSWAHFGDPLGRPLVYLHGFPGSRLEAAFTDAAAKACGLSVLAPDRPGYGGSCNEPERTLSDWPKDLVNWLDALGYGEVLLLGVSGGGPYALACAHAMPRRIRHLGLVAPLGPVADFFEGTQGMGPVPRWALWQARHDPNGMSFLYRQFARLLLANQPERMIHWIFRTAAAPDRKVFANEHLQSALTNSIREAFRQGPQGSSRDLALYAGYWDFPIEAIEVPATLWHGTEDDTVPVAFGQHIGRRLPHCQVHILEQHAHFSLALGETETVLATLASK